MSAARERPLVVVITSVPLLGEAAGAALEFADVVSFDARRGDVASLLRWVAPDAVLVDDGALAAEAAAYAGEHELPVLHVSVRERQLFVLRGADEWEAVGSGEDPTPELLRSVVAGAVFARRGAVA